MYVTSSIPVPLFAADQRFPPSYRPSLNDLPWLRVVAPYLTYLGPTWLRRLLLNLVPISGVQRLRFLTENISERAEEIYRAKKAAIEEGDTQLMHAVGEGKDVMSILRELIVLHIFQAAWTT